MTAPAQVLSVFMAWNVRLYAEAGSYSSGRLRRSDSSCQCSLGREKEGGRGREREGEGGTVSCPSYMSYISYHIIMPIQTF